MEMVSLGGDKRPFDQQSTNELLIPIVTAEDRTVGATLGNGPEFQDVVLRKPSRLGQDNWAFVDDEGTTANLLGLNEEKFDRKIEESDESDDQMNNQDEDQRKDWDAFGTHPPPDEDETYESEWIEFFIKLFKVIAYIITFILVLICGVMSKSLLLLMTSMIKANQTTQMCNFGIPEIEVQRDKRFSSIILKEDPERVAWIWCLFFAVIAPDVFSFFRSLRICIFKNYERPTILTFLTVFVIETLNGVGISMFVFLILPSFDTIKAAMIANAFSLIPAILLVLSGGENLINTTLNSLSMAIQLISVIAWSYIAWYDGNARFWYVPIPLLLVSLSWWENFINVNSKNLLIQKLWTVKNQLQTKNIRYCTYVYISIWKIIVIFSSMITLFYLSEGIGVVKVLFKKFPQAFQEHQINYMRDKSNLEAPKLIEGEMNTFVANHWAAIWLLLAQVCITYIGYATAKFTCKICIQPFSFALPINLTVPVLISFLISMARVSLHDKCLLTENLFFEFQYVFWNFDKNNLMISMDLSNGSLKTIIHNILIPLLWNLSLISQIWITIHIWYSTTERLASSEKLFVRQFYNSVVIDQSLAMNRRRINDDFPIKGAKGQVSINIEEENEAKSSDSHFYESVNEPTKNIPVGHPSDYITRIYACATMWHENADEMVQMLKSVMRLDADQCARRLALEYFNANPALTDYYEIEFHIYFDDAFEQGETDEEDDRILNRFVMQLIEQMDQAAINVHECGNIRLKLPKMMPTPYGGRLVWTLPGRNKLIAHLKDKILIRHRKRWSQCMYLYYLLGHRIAEKPIENERKEIIAENTFVLALDGDINFQPHALHLLIDLMKKNKNLGAACGRIHPIGTGPMVWYQKFEYAIAHWLQKATEHVFGCVLCSPGCFSLFRARALMDKSVMHKYTTVPSEAIHYVQYDQGEDRWLCTLMLQQGWRVEYCAASDSYTHAPEAFGEFFTQRRRWAPSTMANIMDLLGEYKRTVAVNENISRLYIIYQAMLMVGTILSPGTIFLMVVGALNTVMGFKSDIALLANLIPILSFAILCYVAKKNDYKIFYAQILSVIYALLMLAVLVGTAIEMFEKSVLTPNSIFFLSMIGSFVVAAILHPQEFTCVFPLFIYLLCVPAMYLLLTIYSIIELHVVSWGTREVKSKLTAKEQAAAAAAAAEAAATAAAAKKKNFLGFLDLSQYQNKTGFFSCMCCSSSKAEEDSAKISEIKSQVNSLCESVSTIKQNIDRVTENKTKTGVYRKQSAVKRERKDGLPIVVESSEYDSEESVFEEQTNEVNNNSSFKPKEEERKAQEPKTVKKDNDRPIWTQDKRMAKFPMVCLPLAETQFWKDFIPKYLLPFDADPKKEARITEELKELRNKVVFAFGIMNTIFILFVFLLQMHKDIFGIKIPSGIRNYTKIHDPEEDKVIEKPVYNYVNMDPIGLVLVVFFGTILFIQLIGMFLHRFGTLTHLLAFVDLNFCSRKPEELDEEFFIDKNIVNIVRDLQRLRGIEEEVPDGNKRRPSMVPKQPLNMDLVDAFRKRVMDSNMDNIVLSKVSELKRKSTIHALRRRRDTTIELVRSASVRRPAGAGSGNNEPRNSLLSVPVNIPRITDRNMMLNGANRNRDSRV